MKKSFTLIEVMISIVIFSLLVLFMSKVITSLHISINSLESNYNSTQTKKNVINTLYMDILENKKIEIINKNKKYSILSIQTANSLYDLSMPYVVWYVSKKDNKLMRLEYYKKFKLPIDKGNLDGFLNVKIFKIYKNRNKYFIFIRDKNNKDIYFEI